jgi:hypothetical protein
LLAGEVVSKDVAVKEKSMSHRLGKNRFSFTFPDRVQPFAPT